MVRAMKGLEIAIAVAATAATTAACGPQQRAHEGGADAAGGGGGGGGGGDASTGSNSGSGSDSQTFVYAHTASTLFQVNPDTYAVTEIGDFQWSAGADQMTDIAIDKTGTIIGVSFTAVYQVNPATAAATQLSASLDGMFNGLSFVPAAAIGQTGDDVLVGTRASDGMVFRIDPTTGATTAIGNMGGAYESSGDLVAVAGFGTVQTVPGTGGGDMLATLAAGTFTASPAPNPTGFTDVWGVAFWKGQVFGFTDTGQFITIDPQTGVGTLISASGNAWWGAAVTTTAPVID
jgi:hypothetical protein